MSLKLYVDKKFVDEKLSYTPLLFPFWSPKIKKSTPFISAVWARHTFDAAYYCLVEDAASADYLLLPHNYWLLKTHRPERLNAFIQETRLLGKPILIDAYGDSDAEIPVENARILRTSQYRFNMKPNEIMLPAYVEDLLETYPIGDAERTRAKTSPPIVGFVGWAEIPYRARVKSWLMTGISLFRRQYAAFIPGVSLRKRCLKRLSASPEIQTNFLIRRAYSGHTSTITEDIQTLRTQFIENIRQSDYTLTVKGNGNYSQRFYETLSLGRIPLFLDTQCVLPLESRINYRDCCLMVDERDLDRLPEIVAEFHRAVSDEQFRQMQQRAREIFETYLRVDVFTKYLVEDLLRMTQG